MKTQQETYTAQHNVEQEVLFPTSQSYETSEPVKTDEVVILGNNSVEHVEAQSERAFNAEEMFQKMFANYAAALRNSAYTDPQPIYDTVLDETGLQFVEQQVGERPPAIDDMYDTLILYVRGSVLGGNVAMKPALFSETVTTLDEYIEAHVQDGIQTAMYELNLELATPEHISLIEDDPQDETTIHFKEAVKKITGKTLDILGIAPLFHSSPIHTVPKHHTH